MATKSGTPCHEGIVVIQYLEEAKMTALVALGVIVGLGFLIVFSLIFNGYALSVLWGWFVVPTFGTPALGVVPAIGILMTMNYLICQMHNCKHDYKKEEMTLNKEIAKVIAKVIAITLMKPSLALFFGWIVHLFM